MPCARTVGGGKVSFLVLHVSEEKEGLGIYCREGDVRRLKQNGVELLVLLDDYQAMCMLLIYRF